VNKQRVTQKLPIVLSATALVVAVLGVTPLGEAAYNAVSFARNSGAVNGIKASRTPKPGRLIPLGANGKFPESVIGTGPQGPAGQQGPAGPAASNLYAVVNPNGTVYKSKGMVGLSKTATGTYQITFNRSLDDCSVIAIAGGHRTGPDSWMDPQKGVASVRTFGQVAEIKMFVDNGFSGGIIERDLGFHTAALC
jgi:hypothetical protein